MRHLRPLIGQSQQALAAGGVGLAYGFGDQIPDLLAALLGGMEGGHMLASRHYAGATRPGPPMFRMAPVSISAEQCRQKIRDLIAEAVGEADAARREGLLELADQWAEVARRRPPGEMLN